MNKKPNLGFFILGISQILLSLIVIIPNILKNTKYTIYDIPYYLFFIAGILLVFSSFKIAK